MSIYSSNSSCCTFDYIKKSNLAIVAITICSFSSWKYATLFNSVVFIAHPLPLTSPLSMFVLSRNSVSVTHCCIWRWNKKGITDLIHNILADEVTDSHELLRPFLIGVSGTQFHRDCAAPCDLTKIVHTETEKVLLPFHTALRTNFECMAINHNQSFRVMELYCHEFLLSKTNHPETKGSRKGCKQQEKQAVKFVCILCHNCLVCFKTSFTSVNYCFLMS